MAEIGVENHKDKYGFIFVLDKNGQETKGKPLPLYNQACVIGRHEEADIRINKPAVSEIHCTLIVDEDTGQVVLENQGNTTEVNEILILPHTKVDINHQDVIQVGGRCLRFQYPPPDFKPKPGSTSYGKEKTQGNPTLEEKKISPAVENEAESVGDEIESVENCVKATEPEMATPMRQDTAKEVNGINSKRVSFGPYLSPEQFDHTLPPATPIKRGATPRRSARIFNGLKSTKSDIEPVPEEESCGETPSFPERDENTEGQSTKNQDTSMKLMLEETVMEGAEQLSSNPVSEDTLIVSRQPLESSGEQSSGNIENGDVSTTTKEPVNENEDSSEGETSTLVDNASMLVNRSLSSILDVTCGSTVEEKIPNSLMEGDDDFTEVDENVIQDPLIKSTTGAVKSEMGGEIKNDENNMKSRLRSKPQTPKSDYADVRGVKQLLKTPKPLTETPKADYTDVRGVKNLMQTPKSPPKSPRSDYSDVDGIKKLLQTPKPVLDSPKADYTDVLGVKQLMNTPKPPLESPKADYTNVLGVKELMKTPQPPPKTPEADYTDVVGVKELLQTPRPAPETPKADYTNVDGVKRLLETPRPVNETPKADYTDVRGVKKLLQTPRPAPETPRADYTNVEGLKKLLRTPKNGPQTPKADYSNIDGVKELLETPAGKSTKETSNSDERITELDPTTECDSTEEDSEDETAVNEAGVNEASTINPDSLELPIQPSNENSGSIEPSVDLKEQQIDNEVVSSSAYDIIDNDSMEKDSKPTAAPTPRRVTRPGAATATPKVKDYGAGEPNEETKDSKVEATPRRGTRRTAVSATPKVEDPTSTVEVTEQTAVVATPRRVSRRGVATPKVQEPSDVFDEPKLNVEETEIAQVEATPKRTTHRGTAVRTPKIQEPIADERKLGSKEREVAALTPKPDTRRGAVAATLKSEEVSAAIEQTPVEDESTESEDKGTSENDIRLKETPPPEPKESDSTTEETCIALESVEPTAAHATPRRGARRGAATPKAQEINAANEEVDAAREVSSLAEVTSRRITRRGTAQTTIAEGETSTAVEESPVKSKTHAEKATPKRSTRREATSATSEAHELSTEKSEVESKEAEPSVEQVSLQAVGEAETVEEHKSGNDKTEETPVNSSCRTATSNEEAAAVSQEQETSVTGEDSKVESEEATAPPAVDPEAGAARATVEEPNVGTEETSDDHVATPKRRTRRGAAAKSKEKEFIATEEESKVTPTPPRRRKREETTKVVEETRVTECKTRPKRGRKNTESTQSEDSDSTVAPAAPSRAKRTKKKEHETLSSTPLKEVRVSLTRCPEAEELVESSTSPAKVETPRGKRKRAISAFAEVEVKTTKRTVGARSRGAQTAESSSCDQNEEASAEVEPKRTTRSRKTTAAPAKTESPKQQTRTTRGKIVALDDVEMLHEGKGHAADIHGAHEDSVDDDNGSPPASRRGKKRVHFSPNVEPAASPEPKVTRGRKASAKKEVEEVVPAEEPTPTTTKRGRGAKAAIEEETSTTGEEKKPASKSKRTAPVESPTPAPATSRGRTTRGRAATVAPPPSESDETKNTETEKEEANPAPKGAKRGRGKTATTKITKAANESSSKEDSVHEASPRRTRRTRRN